MSGTILLPSANGFVEVPVPGTASYVLDPGAASDGGVIGAAPYVAPISNFSLQEAIDYLDRIAEGRGGTVWLPYTTSISLTTPITPRPNVTVRGGALEVPSWSHGASVGLFHVDGVDNFCLRDMAINTNKLCSPAYVTGGARGFGAHGLTLNECRSIFFHVASGARLSDIIAQGGTAVIGCGANSGAAVSDIAASNILAYDLEDEPLDINFNTVGFSLDGFFFRNCATGGGEGGADIGGGTCSDIALSNGVVDLGGAVGFTKTAFKIKLATKRVTLTAISMVNADPAFATAYAIHIADACEGINMFGCNVDATFARGLTIENGTAKDILWKGGRNDSRAIVHGQNVRLEYAHDGANTAASESAVSFGSTANKCIFNGLIRNRPSASAVVAASGSSECGLGSETVIENCLRGFEGQSGSAKLFVKALEGYALQREGVLFNNVPSARIHRVRTVNSSAASAGTYPAVQLNSGCDQAVIGDVISEGATGGQALVLNAPSPGDIDQVSYQRAITIGTAATGVTSTNVTNLDAGTALTW